MSSPILLTGKQRRFLRSLAHPLKPVLQVGHSGVGDGLVEELGRALEIHELLKVKRLKECPLTAGELAEELAGRTGAAIAQIIGGTVLLYRPRAEEPAIVLPRGE